MKNESQKSPLIKSLIPYQNNQPPLLLSLKKTPLKQHFLQQQNYLTKYRTLRPRLDAEAQRQSMIGIFCSGVWKNLNLPFVKENENRMKIKFCSCEKSEDGWCKLMLSWIEQFYEWKTDKKFMQVYQYYNKKGSVSSARKIYFGSKKSMMGNSISLNGSALHKKHSSESKELPIIGKIQITQLYQQEQLSGVQYQLKKVLKSLRLEENALDQQTYKMLTRVLLSYRKHVNYYNKGDKIIPNFENCIYIWLLIGVFYHVGEQIESSKLSFSIRGGQQCQTSPYKTNMSCVQYLQESMLFWSLDILMNTIGEVNTETLKNHAFKIQTLFDQYFPNQYRKMQKNDVDINKIILLWLQQLMCGYMNLQNLGFYVSSIIKYGWNFIYKVVLSYLQKRIDFIERSARNSKEEIIEALINSDEEWPMIFCNSTTFTFDKEKSGSN